MAKIKRVRIEALGPSAAVLASILLSTTATAADQPVEQVIVTGSYIKRDNFDLSSPLTVVNADAIAETGAPNIGETLYNQTFNFGMSRVQNFLGGTQLTDSAVTNNNLRGLGAGATLELMNGKLFLAGNANYTYPQLAIERVETLLDGASALYGSNAIAGVVNYVPYTKFDGIKVMADVRGRAEGGGQESVFGLLAGMSNDNDDFVLGFESRHRDALKASEIPKYTNIAAATSGTGNPGSFVVPTRLGTGALNTSVTRADPGCGNQAGNPGNLNSIEGNRPNGTLVMTAGAPTGCNFHFQEFWDYKTKWDGQMTYLHYNHDFSDALRFKGEVVYNRSTQVGRGSPINGSLNANIVHNIIGGSILGEHPGNPYRAYVDANGNNAIDAGEGLFASDICTRTACAGVGDGIPDRDVNGDGTPDIGAQGDVRNRVVLAPNPRDPNGGTRVAFNEDVRLAGWRPLGKQPRGIPSSNNDDYSAPTGNKFTFTRYLGGFEADLGKNWTLNADYHFNHLFGVGTGVDASPTAIGLGLIGKLGPQQNQWFNPFNTSQYQCVDRVCGANITPATSPAYNSQFVLDQVMYLAKTTTNTFQHTFDLVTSTSSLFSLPAGDVGLAVGAQYLKYAEDTFASERTTGCDAWAGGCIYNFEGDRNTQSAFFESQVPLLKSDSFGKVDLSLAGRYTQVEGKDSNFDPKVGLIYQPFDMLSLRASWGTSFIVPSLRAEQAVAVALLETNDPTCALSGGDCNSATRQYLLNITQPNANLENETGESRNIGFTLRFLEGDLTVQGDWVNITYDNRISSSTGSAALNADFVRFQAYVAAQCGGSPSAACQRTARNTWIGGGAGLENPAIQRAGGQISSISGSWFNAAGVETTQLDASVKYGFDIGTLGRMHVGVDGTYVEAFDVQDFVTSPVIRYVGKINEGSRYPAVPRVRLMPRVNWSLNDHSVTVLGYYHSNTYIRGTGAAELRLPSYARFNLAYTYTMNGIFGSNDVSEVTIGSENVTDKDAHTYDTLGGYNSQLEDPIGRTIYARFTHTFK